MALEDDGGKGPPGSMLICPPPTPRRMLKLNDLRRPREFFLEDPPVSERSKGTFAGSDAKEGLGCDVLLVFEPLERADVRTDSQGVLVINRWAMLGVDGELRRRIRIEYVCGTWLLPKRDQ